MAPLKVSLPPQLSPQSHDLFSNPLPPFTPGGVSYEQIGKIYNTSKLIHYSHNSQSSCHKDMTKKIVIDQFKAVLNLLWPINLPFDLLFSEKENLKILPCGSY